MRGLALLFALAASTAYPRLVPLALDFADLAGPRPGWQAASAFGRALREEGIVQVFGVPGFAAAREQALRHAHACLMEAPRTQEMKLDDGTVRRTLAAASGPTFGARSFEHGSDGEACRAFGRSGGLFRHAVAVATGAFVQRLSDLVGEQLVSPVLARMHGAAAYETMAQAVAAGDRLEHFHSYQVPAAEGAGERAAVDFHVDQGLFIAFVPAIMVNASVPEIPQASHSSGIFLLRTRDGREVKVDLQPDGAVFLLGDTINRLLEGRAEGVKLHVPSHAFRMPRGGRGLHRVWYGMMQLPPADAEAGRGLSFGQLRSRLIAAQGMLAGDEPALVLGCTAGRQARELRASSCNNDTQFFCWMRCFEFTSAASPSVCAAEGKQLKCVNQFDQVDMDPSNMGDFWPTCSNSTTPWEPRPSPPQPATLCAGWNALVNDTNYTNRVAFTNETYLLWSVLGGVLHAKMVHYGVAGWLGFGIRNMSDNGLSGMLGGKVVMGLNDPVAGPSVAEYHIDYQNTGFRWWNKPVTNGISQATVQVDSCFTTMSLSTSSIYGQPLNVTSGTNNIIWAVTHYDYPTQAMGGYAGYHRPVANLTGSPTMFRGYMVLSFAGVGTPATSASSSTSVSSTTSAPPTTSAASSHFGSGWKAAAAVVLALVAAGH